MWSVKSVSRASLRQGRQSHLKSGTPGQMVWAQSWQTNRPSLWAIIGLKSIPALSYGQRRVRIVSVGIGALPHRAKEARTQDSNRHAP